MYLYWRQRTTVEANWLDDIDLFQSKMLTFVWSTIFFGFCYFPLPRPGIYTHTHKYIIYMEKIVITDSSQICSVAK